MTTPAPIESATTESGEPEARDTTTARLETPNSQEGAAAVAREAPIDIVKLAGGSLSPLVKDAQQALLTGQTVRALSLANRAVAERPTDADAWLTLAAAQKASGDLTAARETYVNCVQHAQTPTLNHCRILAGSAGVSDVHGPAASDETPQAHPEVAQPHSPSAAPPRNLGIRAPESAPAASKSNDQPPPPPPAARTNEAAPPDRAD
jgi:hypothetical protein